MPFTDCKSLLGWQQGFPSILNIAVVDVVSTTVEYLVPNRHAACCKQVCSTYLQVHTLCKSSPIVKTTGAEIVVVVGIDCAKTMQYLPQLL